MLLQWHSFPPPPSEKENDKKLFNYEDKDPNDRAYNDLNEHDLLNRFISHLDHLRFVIQDYSWKELIARAPQGMKIPNSKNELFVKIANWFELWSLSYQTNFNWNISAKDKTPDCRGRPPAVYKLRTVDYAENRRDPIHNWGLTKEDTGIVDYDGSKLPARLSWACCGLPYINGNENKNGCWFGNNYQVIIPYDPAPGFGDKVWEQYYAIPQDQTIEQLWDVPIQMGTMWLEPSKYRLLDRRIRTLKETIRPLVVRMITNQFRKKQDTDGSHFLDPFEELSPEEQALWDRFVLLISEYNKIQCLKQGDILNVSRGFFVWTKDKFEGLLLSDGRRIIIFKDEVINTWMDLKGAVDRLIPIIQSESKGLEAVLIQLSSVSLNMDRVISIQKEIFTSTSFNRFVESEFETIKPVLVKDYLGPIKSLISRKDREELRQLLNRIIAANNELLRKRDRLNMFYKVLRPIDLKTLDGLLLDIKDDPLFIKPKGKSNAFVSDSPELQKYKQEYSKLKSQYLALRNDTDLLKTILANREGLKVDPSGVQLKLQALQRAKDDLNNFLDNKAKSLLQEQKHRMERERAAEEERKMKLLIEKARVDAQKDPSIIAWEKLSSRAQKILKDKNLSDDQKTSLRVLIKFVLNLESIADIPAVKNEAKRAVDAKILELEDTLRQLALDAIRKKADLMRDANPISDMDEVTLQRILDGIGVSKEDMQNLIDTRKFKELSDALWLKSFDTENQISLDVVRKAYDNAISKIETQRQENRRRLQPIRDWLNSTDKQFIIDNSSLNIGRLHLETTDPFFIPSQGTFYRDDLKSWQRNVDGPVDKVDFLYIRDDFVFDNLVANWNHFLDLLEYRPYNLSKEKQAIEQKMSEIQALVNPIKIDRIFIPTDINHLQDPLQVKVKKSREKILSTAAFKWIDSSCWIDAPFTSLFALPELSIEQSIRGVQKVYIPSLELIGTEKKEKLESKCFRYQDLHDFVMKDIQFLQRDRPPVLQVCQSMSLFTDCVDMPARIGSFNYADDTLHNLIRFYDIPKNAISLQYKDSPDIGDGSEFEDRYDYVLFSLIMQRPGHFTTLVKDPVKGDWYFYDMNFVLKVTRLDQNGLPVIVSDPDYPYYYTGEGEGIINNISETKYTGGDPQKFIVYRKFFIKKTIWEGLRAKALPENVDESLYDEALDLYNKSKALEKDIDGGAPVGKSSIEHQKIIHTAYERAKDLYNQYQGLKIDEFGGLIQKFKEFDEWTEKRLAQRLERERLDKLDLESIEKDLEDLLKKVARTKEFEEAFTKLQTRTLTPRENSTSVNELNNRINDLIRRIEDAYRQIPEFEKPPTQVKNLARLIELTEGDEFRLEQAKKIKDENDLIHIWGAGIIFEDISKPSMRIVPDVFKTKFGNNETFLKAFSQEQGEDPFLDAAKIAARMEENEQLKLIYQWSSGEIK